MAKSEHLMTQAAELGYSEFEIEGAAGDAGLQYLINQLTPGVSNVSNSATSTPSYSPPQRSIKLPGQLPLAVTRSKLADMGKRGGTIFNKFEKRKKRKKTRKPRRSKKTRRGKRTRRGNNKRSNRRSRKTRKGRSRSMRRERRNN